MCIIDCIFPKQCVICSKVGEDICTNCLKKIPRYLPQCPICHKLNNGYYTHKNCYSKQIQCFTGWAISKELEIKLKQKIFTYKNLLTNMISYLSAEETIKKSFIIPLYSKDPIILGINKAICNDLRSYGRKQYILLTGFNLESIDFQIKNIPPSDIYTEIKIFTLFYTSTLQ